jgi:hypothetical protein
MYAKIVFKYRNTYNNKKLLWTLFSLNKLNLSENFSEDALTLHEHQVEVMRNYYEENSAIFKLVEKRENLWKKFLEFEVCAVQHYSYF